MEGMTRRGLLGWAAVAVGLLAPELIAQKSGRSSVWVEPAVPRGPLFSMQDQCIFVSNQRAVAPGQV